MGNKMLLNNQISIKPALLIPQKYRIRNNVNTHLIINTIFDTTNTNLLF